VRKEIFCKGLLAAFAAVFIHGCAVVADTSASAPVGNTRNGGFDGRGAVMRFAVVAERHYTDRVSGYCEVWHASNMDSGWPFNNEPESFIDAAGCGVRVRIF
jgi:hypothetical protein